MKGFGALLILRLAALVFEPTPALAAQEIRPFVRGSYQQIVTARQGRPFVVSFWSLTCHYCMAEMAMFKKLLKQHPGLDLVLIATDTPEDQPSVSAALAKFSLGKADAWVFADSYTERLRFEVDRKWQGELPRTYLYGVKSEVVAVSGKLARAEIELWLKIQHVHR